MSLWCPRLGFCPKTQVYKVVLLSEHYGVEESKRVPTLVYTLGVKGNNVWKRVNVGDDVHGETTDCFSQWNYSLGCDIPFCTTIYIYIYIYIYIHLTLRMSVFNWFHRLLRLSHLSDDKVGDQSWGVGKLSWVSWAKAYNIEFTMIMIKTMLFFIPRGKTRKPYE